MYSGLSTAQKLPWGRYLTLRSYFSPTSVMVSTSTVLLVEQQCITVFPVDRQHWITVHFFASKKSVLLRNAPVCHSFRSFRFAYDSSSAVYKDIDLQRIRNAEFDEPPDNCPVCLLKEQRGTEMYGQKLKAGVAWHGVNYHIYDFVMIKAEQGPCHIGHIINIRFPQNYRSHDLPIVTVKLMGRICTIKTRPRDVIKDEAS